MFAKVQFWFWLWASLYSSVGKESACDAGDLGLIPGSRRYPGEGNGNLLQCSCLENSMDRRALGPPFLPTEEQPIISGSPLSKRAPFHQRIWMKWWCPWRFSMELLAHFWINYFYSLALNEFSNSYGYQPTGEGRSSPLQCSCLDNPRDGRAWWAAIYGVT